MNKRLKYIDVAKGIATLCVILGHMSITPKFIVNEVYSFHIPLFFFLSGMVLNFDKFTTFKEFLKDKTKKVLVPYLALSLVIWIWVAIIKQSNPLENVYTLNSFIGIFLCAKDTPYYLTLWFVLSLFLSQLILYFMIKNKKTMLRFTILFITFVIAIFVSIIYEPGWPLASDTLPMGTFFLGMGFMARKYFQESSLLLKIRCLPIAFIVNLISACANYNITGRVDLFYQNIGNPLLYIFSAFAGIWMVLIICKLIEKSLVLNFIGQHSLIFYALHRPFFFTLGNTVIIYLKSTNIVFINNSSVLSIVFLVVVCICLSISALIINKFFPFIIGKNYQKGSKYE